MPMPQRNSRRAVQLLSNNSLLSGTGASGISSGTVAAAASSPSSSSTSSSSATTLASSSSGLSNCTQCGCGGDNSHHQNNGNNNSLSSSSSSTTSSTIISSNNSREARSSSPANGRVYGNRRNPMAGVAAAAAASASASSSALNNISASSPSSAHHHQHQHQQPPPPPPPPLITDTLTACLDVNGTYICTSYSPRCYIIQKVTPNTVTVTPTHLIGSEGTSTTGGITGSHRRGPLVPLLSVSSGGSSSTGPTGRKFVKSGSSSGVSGGGAGAYASSPPSSNLHHPSQNSYSSRAGGHRQYHHPQQHHHGGHHNQSQNSHRYGQNNYHQRRSNTPTKYAESGIISNSLSAVPTPTSTVLAAYQAGRLYMNGEVLSTPTAFIGEESTPAMVLQSSSSASAGTQISETRVLNGLKDGSGMPKEQMKSVESQDDFADSSRRSDPGSGANLSDIPKEDLKRLLLQQLEYYFSPENLANDKFLVSQMDSDHYVSISTLANFNMVKKLTGDIDLVTEVLRDSKNVQVHSDGKRVRPVSHRTVVILRGIPESTPVDEIKALFNSDNCPKCNSCEFAFNDSWYVSFESDEDAQRAHRYLREDVKEFKGQPIMARIKSRPTTLLAQGAGVHLKNGFHQPAQVMGTYMPPSYVPGSQTGPTTAVTPTPMYAHGQTVPSVFPIPPNYSYGPWPSFFGMAPDQLSQMYPMNGLPPQHQPNTSYQKTLQMNPRPRNPNQVRPRRPPTSSSDNQGINGVVGASGASTGVSAHQSYGNPPRKNNSAPQPLLNLVQTPPALPLVNPTTSHNHSQSHLPHSSVQAGGNAISQNGNRHYGNSLPASHSLDYHPSGSMRPYRGGSGVNDSRPRSSLSNRKGPLRREEEANYDGPSASPSISTKVPSTRGAPPVPVPQPTAESLGPHQSPGNINLDLEGSQFPPLPGSGQTSGKNGDAIFEGRLSDVVKGVKNMKTSNSSDKEDTRTSAVNMSTEIIVSANDDNFGDVREVSAASPIKDLEVEKKTEHSSSQTVAPRKEFREVGVGSADDTHDIRSSHNKSSVISGARCKETADKSTRTDEALLNGDQCQGMKTGSNSNSAYSLVSISQNGGNRKSSSQTSTSKSPVPGKRAMPALQGQNVSSTSVSVGPEVPYSSRNVTSPVTNPAKFTTSQPGPGGGGSTVSNSAGNSVHGRGANPYIAKQNTDNNNTRANGMIFNNTGSSLDRDAFPSPGYVKSVPSCKPFPTSADQNSKEVSRPDSDKDRKEPGQGESKKSDDCSNEEREGPVRLSYAQVAQQRKEAGGSSNNSHASATTSNNCVTSSASNSASAVLSSNPVALEEKKRSNAKDTKDARPPPKNQRGGGGDRDRDRDRNFRRSYRNRMMSDHSDGGSGASGEPNRRLPKPSRSPK